MENKVNLNTGRTAFEANPWKISCVTITTLHIRIYCDAFNLFLYIDRFTETESNLIRINPTLKNVGLIREVHGLVETWYLYGSFKWSWYKYHIYKTCPLHMWLGFPTSDTCLSTQTTRTCTCIIVDKMYTVYCHNNGYVYSWHFISNRK